MVQNIFKGLGIALVTPFTSDGSVDYQSLSRLVEYQLKNGVEDTSTGITHNQRLMVLKKLIVKNKKRQNSTKRNKTPKK